MEIGAWDIAAALGKAATYAATLGAAGAVFFTFHCGDLLREQQRTLFRRLIGSLTLGAAALSGLRILLLGGSMGGNLSGMFDGAFVGMILGGGEGRSTGFRMAGLFLMLFAFSRNSAFRALAIAGATLAATSFAWVGHVHGLPSIAVPSLLLGLHLLCAAFWLGALPPLWILSSGGDEMQIAAAASRFGKLALWIVALLVTVGASLLWLLIGTTDRFWNSDYGNIMAIKLLSVAFILSLAAWNKLALTPRLLNRRPGAVASFRRSVLAEMFVGALILLITAALTTFSGPA